MASTPAVILGHLETVFPGSMDEKVLSTEDYKTLAWFFHYGQNVFSEFGMDWLGASFRQRGTRCTLAVKAIYDDAQRVAFVTGRTPMDCMRIFVRKWHQGTVSWYLDKYQ